MRVLFTSHAGSGHWHPLVPLATSMRAAGHDVAFATTPKACTAIEANGFTCLPVGHDEPDDVLRERRRFLLDRSPAEQAVIMVGEVFAGANAEAALPDMLDLGRTWRPDVVVRENLEFTGFLMAEALGLAHATVQVTAWRPPMHVLAVAALERLRPGAGMPSDPDPARMFRHLLLIPRPADLLDRSTLPSSAHLIQPLIFDQSGEERLPAWLEGLPDLPIVFATLGTVFNRAPGVLSAIIAGLHDEPIMLIVAIGRDLDPVSFGPQPAHVHIERYIPQSLLFPRCAAVVTHGGSGTVMAALRHGLPMVLIPIAADQPENARRCVELGLGRVIEPTSRTPETIRQATREVLANPDYRASALRMREEIDALPGIEHAVALIEQVTVARRD